MNRIRRIGGKFQVLITPTYLHNPNFEIMLGNWDDANLRNFKILEFDSLNDAMGEAFKYPDIDWNKLVSIHMDAYQYLVAFVKGILDKHKWLVEYDTQLANPTEIKNMMFERVLHMGNRFTLLYHCNDVISINIINPWTQNIQDIAKILQNTYDLRIIKKYTSPHIIHLIGKTDMGTTYEIKLWPSVIFNWAKWIAQHNPPRETANKVLNDAIETQNKIDSTNVIR